MAKAKNPSTRVEVDQDEYRALCMLRDGAHEDLKIKLAQSDARYKACTEINLEQVHRLAVQDIELSGARRTVEILTQKLNEANARILAMTPVATGVPQPAIGKG